MPYTVSPSYQGSRAWSVLKDGEVYSGLYFSKEEAEAAATSAAKRHGNQPHKRRYQLTEKGRAKITESNRG